MPGTGELADVVVVDLSTDLGGAYCAKLFTDGGATVTHVEPPGGDPWRRWQWSGEPVADGDGVLFRYLRHGQRSITATEGVRCWANSEAMGRVPPWATRTGSTPYT